MENNIEQLSRTEELIYRFLTKQASQQEVLELRTWLKNNPNHSIDFKNYQTIWFLVQRSSRKTKYNEEIKWADLKSEILTENKKTKIVQFNPRKQISKFQKIAAIFIIAFTCGLFAVSVFKTKNKTQVLSFTEQSVPRGSRSFIILPDSSTVWLNSGSKIRYSTEFNDKGREVFLEGEAFFDVKKVSKKAFFVHTRGVSIKVLGTAFNVKAYPNEKVETTVQRGLVQVMTKSDKTIKSVPILLHPNQQAVFEIEQTKIKSSNQNKNIFPSVDKIDNTDIYQLKPAVVAEVDAEIASSWKDKRWIINHENLKDLAAMISRRFAVEVIIDSALEKYHFSGTLEEESLEQILNLIQLSSPIQFTINQKTIQLFEKK